MDDETQAAGDDCIKLSTPGGPLQVGVGATTHTSKHREQKRDCACTTCETEINCDDIYMRSEKKSSRQSHKSVNDAHQSVSCRTRSKTNVEDEVEVEDEVVPGNVRRYGRWSKVEEQGCLATLELTNIPSFDQVQQ